MSNVIRSVGNGNVISNCVQSGTNGESQTISIGRGHAEINGKHYTYPSSASVSCINDELYVDGKLWAPDEPGKANDNSAFPNYSVKIVFGDTPGSFSIEASESLSIHGNVAGNITTRGDVVVKGDVGSGIETRGNVTVRGNVAGNITTRGNVEVGGDVTGSIETKANVSCGDVGGSIKASKVTTL